MNEPRYDLWEFHGRVENTTHVVRHAGVRHFILAEDFDEALEAYRALMLKSYRLGSGENPDDLRVSIQQAVKRATSVTVVMPKERQAFVAEKLAKQHVCTCGQGHGRGGDKCPACGKEIW